MTRRTPFKRCNSVDKVSENFVNRCLSSWWLTSLLLGLVKGALPEPVQTGLDTLATQTMVALRLSGQLEPAVVAAAAAGFIASQWLHFAADGIRPDRWGS